MAKAIVGAKGQLGNLQGITLILIVIAMCVGAVYMVLGSFLSENEEIVGNDTATAGLDKAITSIDIIPEMLPFIVSIFMVIIIVGLVFLIPKSGGGA